MLATESNFPTCGFNGYCEWYQKVDLMGMKNVSQASVELMYTTSIYRKEEAKPIECSKGDIVRFEILEIIVRLALLVYKSALFISSDPTKQPPEGKYRVPEAIEKFIKTYCKDHPAISIADTHSFRRDHLYTKKVSKFFERNLAVFKQIFSRYMHFGKECMDIPEAQEFVFKVG